MTTFEITTIALLAVIMLMVIILVKTAIGGFHDVWQQLNANWEQLRKIETHEDISTSTTDVPSCVTASFPLCRLKYMSDSL